MLDYVFVAANQYVVNAMVRGYLVYQEVWKACVDEILSRIREVGTDAIAVPSTWFYENT